MFMVGRTPHGVCELKLRGMCDGACKRSHTPHGVCELKWSGRDNNHRRDRRTPHGVCELKYALISFASFPAASHPAGGV